MADDYINMHKRIAMGMPNAETHLKKGGKVAKYANGGAVAESRAAHLPAKGAPLKADFNAGKAKVASLKNGGMPKKTGLMIAISLGKKPSARGR